MWVVRLYFSAPFFVIIAFMNKNNLSFLKLFFSLILKI
ncbi:MAG: hypothetical protein LBQ24_05640 [Candidatus Peribacteria bacterium]|nr:hypothetical protein [Candidatus Peribacteria bacterium]